jgi:hypothetical protein
VKQRNPRNRSDDFPLALLAASTSQRRFTCASVSLNRAWASRTLYVTLNKILKV